MSLTAAGRAKRNGEANSRVSPETTPSRLRLDQAAPELPGNFYSNQYIYFLHKQEICAFHSQWFLSLLAEWDGQSQENTAQGALSTVQSLERWSLDWTEIYRSGFVLCFSEKEEERSRLPHLSLWFWGRRLIPTRPSRGIGAREPDPADTWRPWRPEASRGKSGRPGAGGCMALYDMRMAG